LRGMTDANASGAQPPNHNNGLMAVRNGMAIQGGVH
jgi:hypothetical protein